mgnify:CR=1 FL=1
MWYIEEETGLLVKDGGKVVANTDNLNALKAQLKATQEVLRKLHSTASAVADQVAEFGEVVDSETVDYLDLAIHDAAALLPNQVGE